MTWQLDVNMQDTEYRQRRDTCMPVCYIACLPEFVSMWTEMKYGIDVVRKYPEPEVHQATELVDCLDVWVGSTAMASV